MDNKTFTAFNSVIHILAWLPKRVPLPVCNRQIIQLLEEPISQNRRLFPHVTYDRRYSVHDSPYLREILVEIGLCRGILWTRDEFYVEPGIALMAKRMEERYSPEDIAILKAIGQQLAKDIENLKKPATAGV